MTSDGAKKGGGHLQHHDSIKVLQGPCRVNPRSRCHCHQHSQLSALLRVPPQAPFCPATPALRHRFGFASIPAQLLRKPPGVFILREPMEVSMEVSMVHRPVAVTYTLSVCNWYGADSLAHALAVAHAHAVTRCMPLVLALT